MILEGFWSFLGIKEKRTALLFLFILGIFLINCLMHAMLLSITPDEPIYMVAGFTYLTSHEINLNREHPPLIKFVGAIPLLSMDLKLPEGVENWKEFSRRGLEHWTRQFGLSSQLFGANKDKGYEIIFWSRVFILIFPLALGIFIFKFANELYGELAGLFALFLFIFESNILAHSSLVTLDLGASAFIFICVYYLYKYIKSGKGLDLVGISCGLALLSKFTGILLIPIIILLLFISWKKLKLGGFEKRNPIFKILVPLVVILIISLLIIWAGYLFRKINLLCGCVGGGYSHIDILGIKIPSFFPEDYLFGFDLVREHSKEGHPAFLMGEYSADGWWYYFIVAFLIKTPIPLLILFTISTILFTQRYVRSRKLSNRIRPEIFLLIPIIILFFYFSFVNKVDIGIRYLLPIYPFIFVLSSSLVPEIKRILKKRIIFVLIFLVLCLWYFLSSMIIFPDHISYFNELIGGPENGHKYLRDSNLDWRQNLLFLGKYVEEKDVKDLRIGIKGWNEFYDYIPEWRVNGTVPCHPINGTIAISIENLYGLYAENMGENTWGLPDTKCYAWLRENYAPIDKIGYSIYIYKIE